MLTTNKIQPKPNKKFDKFLTEEKNDKGEPTGNIISEIPRDVFTTSQDRVKNRPAPRFPYNFTDIHKVDTKKPERTFLQSADLEEMMRKKKRAMLKAKRAVIKAKKEALEATAKSAKKAKGKPGRKPGKK